MDEVKCRKCVYFRNCSFARDVEEKNRELYYQKNPGYLFIEGCRRYRPDAPLDDQDDQFRNKKGYMQPLCYDCQRQNDCRHSSPIREARERFDDYYRKSIDMMPIITMKCDDYQKEQAQERYLYRVNGSVNNADGVRCPGYFQLICIAETATEAVGIVTDYYSASHFHAVDPRAVAICKVQHTRSEIVF